MTRTSYAPSQRNRLKITKYEAGTTVTLSGATFEVVGPDGDTIGVYTTPESGSITIPLVEVGNYTIYERVPPEYHLMDEEPVKQVTVKYGETAEVDFENEPTAISELKRSTLHRGQPGGSQNTDQAHQERRHLYRYHRHRRFLYLHRAEAWGI